MTRHSIVSELKQLTEDAQDQVQATVQGRVVQMTRGTSRQLAVLGLLIDDLLASPAGATPDVRDARRAVDRVTEELGRLPEVAATAIDRSHFDAFRALAVDIQHDAISSALDRLPPSDRAARR